MILEKENAVLANRKLMGATDPKNAEDGTQILEQILPFFTPEFTVTMTLVSGMSEKRDIPLILNSVSSEDTYR